MSRIIKKKQKFLFLIVGVGVFILSFLAVIVQEKYAQFNYIALCAIPLAGLIMFRYLLRLFKINEHQIECRMRPYLSTIIHILLITCIACSIYLLLYKGNASPSNLILDYYFRIISNTVGLVGFIVFSIALFKYAIPKKNIKPKDSKDLAITDISNAEKYTRLVFNPYLDENIVKELNHSIKILVAGRRLPDDLRTVGYINLKQNDLLRYGWNIYKHFHPVNINSSKYRYSVAFLLKNSFKESFNGSEIETIYKKLGPKSDKQISISIYETKDELISLLSNVK